MSPPQVTLAQRLIIWAAALARREDVEILWQRFGEPGLTRAWTKLLPSPLRELYEELSSFGLCWRGVGQAAPSGGGLLLWGVAPKNKRVDPRDGALVKALCKRDALLVEASAWPWSGVEEVLPLVGRADGSLDEGIFLSLARQELLCISADGATQVVSPLAFASLMMLGISRGFVPGWLNAQAPPAASALAKAAPLRSAMTLEILSAEPLDVWGCVEDVGRRCMPGLVARLLSAVGPPVKAGALKDSAQRGALLADALSALEALSPAQIKALCEVLRIARADVQALRRMLGHDWAPAVRLRIKLSFDKRLSALPLEAYASTTLYSALYEADQLGDRFIRASPLDADVLRSCFLPRVKAPYWSPFVRGAELCEPWRGRTVREAVFEGVMPAALAEGLAPGQRFGSTGLPSLMTSF